MIQYLGNDNYQIDVTGFSGILNLESVKEMFEEFQVDLKREKRCLVLDYSPVSDDSNNMLKKSA